MKRIYAMAPRNFQASAAFFWRDSGLLCRALQGLGYDSKVVLQGPGFADDTSEVVRGSRADLCSPAWWKNLGADAIIMIAWGYPEELAIVKAIHRSGTPLVFHLDSSGDCYPVGDYLQALKTIWQAEKGAHPNLLPRLLFYPARLLKWAYNGFLVNGPWKYQEMKLSTFVSITTPSSLRGNAKLCKLYGGKNHPVKLHLTGLPISDLCSLNPETEKENTIVSIARWDAFVQKRPFMLMGICELAGQLPPGWKFEIFGRIPEAMTRWHAKLPLDIQSRVVIHGLQPGEIISHALQRAKIYLCTSSFETGPQTIYEALACGVSVVGLDSQNIAASKHAEIQGHAVLCKEDSPQSFMNSLKESISLWEAAAYKPRQIAEFWAGNNHASNLSRNIISLLNLKK